jgi:hypothetical protein
MQLVEEERTYAEIVKDKSDERANMEVEGRRALGELSRPLLISGASFP